MDLEDEPRPTRGSGVVLAHGFHYLVPGFGIAFSSFAVGSEEEAIMSFCMRSMSFKFFCLGFTRGLDCMAHFGAALSWRRALGDLA